MSDLPDRTPQQQVASLLLGQPVLPWIIARRPARSWRRIADELKTATEGKVDITGQTARVWAANAEPAEQAS